MLRSRLICYRSLSIACDICLRQAIKDREYVKQSRSTLTQQLTLCRIRASEKWTAGLEAWATTTRAKLKLRNSDISGSGSTKERLIKKADNSHQPRARYTKPFLLGGWLFEILSICAALVVFVGVVAILAVYNGRPNPLWTGGVTINTVISVASVLFRVGLMVPVASCISQMTWIWLAKDRRPLYDVARFDQASRSLYGSFQLLFAHHV
jgi:hypothetical protein